MTGDRRIKLEEKKLLKIFNGGNAQQSALVTRLCKDAAFLFVQNADLREQIAEEGVIEEYQNGKDQTGLKESTKVSVYHKNIKSLVSIVKQMIDILPPSGEDKDELMEFLGKR